MAVPVKSENASEIGPTPTYKNIKTLIRAIGKPKEKRLREGADLVIIPIEPVSYTHLTLPTSDLV